MRPPFRALPLPLALALIVLVCAGGNARALPPASLAQAGAQEQQEDGPPPGEERPAPTEERPEPAEEGNAPSQEAIPGPDVPPRVGESRRIDPFDAVDDDGARTPHPAALDYPGHDVVVCEAGCDKTAGTIVYLKKRE